MKKTIGFKLNGKAVSLEVDPSRALLWVLRCDLGLTGAKYGCGEGLCGACTVLVDRQAVRSCQTAVKDVEGKGVTTIEGLADERRTASFAESLRRSRCAPVRVLYSQHDHECLCPTAPESQPFPQSDYRADGRKPVPLRGPQAHRRGHREREKNMAGGQR